jgi:DNA-binding response OmpR family regulator
MGLEGGADDYVTKPFSHASCLRRINAVLRRSNHGGGEELIEADGWCSTQAGHRVMVGRSHRAARPD